MNIWMLILVNVALLGSALMAGVFFAFSTFIMKAFGEIHSEAGAHAMRSINRVIINPWFIGAFLGTTILSLVLGILIIIDGDGKGDVWFLTATVLYFFGTFLVTGIRNVPLNKQLDAIVDSEKEAFWQLYLKQWTLYNHSRTVSSSLAVIFYGIGLMQF